MKRICVCLFVLLICGGCAAEIQQSASSIQNPTERGLMYIATAVVISAVFRAIFNE